VSVRSILWSSLGVIALAACQPNYGDTPVPLRMKGTPADATVTIDDKWIGKLGYVSKHQIMLPPGKHHVTIEHEGYFPWDRAIDADDEPVVLDVALTKIPD
jgi:hypothetical protein